MSASIISDTMVMNSGSDGPVGMISGQNEVDFVKCDCCGLTEECTPSYIQTIRERYEGKWICGLCSEAVKDEILRCQKLISPDEAMARHLSFLQQVSGLGPASGSYCALDSGHDAGFEEEPGGPEVDEVNAEQPDD